LIAAKRCDGCEFWLPPASGEKCGRCSSIKGPISPGGYCDLWSQRVPAPPQGAAGGSQAG
jgi:hypothetical protein